MSTSRAKSSWKLCEFVAHSSTVNCLALSPSNGRTLATGGDDRRVNLWMVGQPNALMSISGITSPVQSVTFNNTENWIGAGSKSGVIKVFDLEENKAVRSISGHKAAICSLDFHRYGDILASGSMDTNLKLWDVRRKGCIFTYKGHNEVLNCVQFSPDGKWIVSASSDCTIKVWDLSAGRMIADFKNHTGAITSVRFHPKEFLLASGSSDRTVKFWDLESFRLVSETVPEATGVKCIQYHPEGVAIFSGGQDSLRVYGWEPVVTHDALPISWGKVADMAISGEQLIGASFAQTNVSLWCIDQKKLKLFSGDSVSPTEREVSPPLSASGRRLFEYQEEVASERHPTQAPQPKAQQSQPQRSTSEEGKEGGDSPPMELREEERKQIFEKRLKLVRTPPKRTHDPFQPPVDDKPPTVLPSAGRPSYQHPRVEPSEDPVIRAFIAPPVSQPSRPSQSKDSRVVGEIRTNHIDVCQILKSRLSVLKKARSEWSVSDPKIALDLAINSGNQAALVDVLNVLYLKRTLWTLDMAVASLPDLRLLFKSKYDAYIVCGCNVLKLILKSFGPVIKTNMASPPSHGAQAVDITREERYEKCHTCHSHLMSLREDIWRLQNAPGPASKLIREQALVDVFSVLD